MYRGLNFEWSWATSREPEIWVISIMIAPKGFIVAIITQFALFFDLNESLLIGIGLRSESFRTILACCAAEGAEPVLWCPALAFLGGGVGICEELDPVLSCPFKDAGSEFSLFWLWLPNSWSQWWIRSSNTLSVHHSPTFSAWLWSWKIAGVKITEIFCIFILLTSDWAFTLSDRLSMSVSRKSVSGEQQLTWLKDDAHCSAAIYEYIPCQVPYHDVEGFPMRER